MILVFVTDQKIGEVRNLPFSGRVSYQNPKYFKANQHPLKCDQVYIHGDYPEIEKCYEGKVVNFDSEFPKEKGSGWYELSDGSSVRGKQEAIEAENNL